MIPFLAHNPSLTTIASGVAKPKAQGQATTKTDTNTDIVSCGVLPIIKLTITDRMAITITIGTNKPLILSASRAIFVLELVASSTNLTILDIVDSLPIFSALYSIYPS